MPQLDLSFASGEDSLSVRRFRVEEVMSRPFKITVTALSPNEQIDLESIVGQPALFRVISGVAYMQVEARQWTGVCKSMRQMRVEPDGLSTYKLTIVPSLWLLSQRRNHRVFQGQSIPDIVDQILAEWRIERIWNVFRDQYPPADLRLQYGESDLAFISRLLEEVGIAYYFVDDIEKGSVLILHEQPHANDPREGPPLAFVDSAGQAQAREIEHVTALTLGHRARPNSHTLRDFDFTRPGYPLFGRAQDSLSLQLGPGEPTSTEAAGVLFEQYHYRPDGFRVAGAHSDAWGATLAARGVQEDRLEKRRVTLATNVLDLAPGVVFTVGGFPRDDLSPGVKLLSTALTIEGTPTDEWSTKVRAVFAEHPYRPPRVTPKPRIEGTQSAVVVGEGDVDVDAFGRVKVLFLWDRESRPSCRVRVSHGWAGPGYGMIAHPRVGHEVLVSFLDGDPDAPIVVGRLFNGSAQVPYPLPDQSTVSTWKSDSIPGSDGFNEIKLEDRKGDEVFSLQAEKDLAKLVKNDETIMVKHDRTMKVESSEGSGVGHDRTRVVGHDEMINVKHDRSRAVGHDERDAVNAGRTTQVGRSDRVEIGHDRVQQIRGDEALAVGKNLTEYIGDKLGTLIKGSSMETTGKNRSVTVGMSRSATVGLTDSRRVGARYSVTMAPGILGMIAGGVSAVASGSILGTLFGAGSVAQSIAAKAVSTPLSCAMAAAGDTPLATLIRSPVEAAQAVLPPQLDGVVEMMEGPLMDLLGKVLPFLGKATKIDMVHRRIELSTGKASIVLDGEDIHIRADGGIFLMAGKRAALSVDDPGKEEEQGGDEAEKRKASKMKLTAKEGDIGLYAMTDVLMMAREQDVSLLGNEGKVVVQSMTDDVLVQGGPNIKINMGLEPAEAEGEVDRGRGLPILGGPARAGKVESSFEEALARLGLPTRVPELDSRVAGVVILSGFQVGEMLSENLRLVGRRGDLAIVRQWVPEKQQINYAWVDANGELVAALGRPDQGWWTFWTSTPGRVFEDLPLNERMNVSIADMSAVRSNSDKDPWETSSLDIRNPRGPNEWSETPLLRRYEVTGPASYGQTAISVGDILVDWELAYPVGPQTQGHVSSRGGVTSVSLSEPVGSVAVYSDEGGSWHPIIKGVNYQDAGLAWTRITALSGGQYLSRMHGAPAAVGVPLQASYTRANTADGTVHMVRSPEKDTTLVYNDVGQVVDVLDASGDSALQPAGTLPDGTPVFTLVPAVGLVLDEATKVMLTAVPQAPQASPWLAGATNLLPVVSKVTGVVGVAVYVLTPVASHGGSISAVFSHLLAQGKTQEAFDLLASNGPGGGVLDELLQTGKFAEYVAAARFFEENPPGNKPQIPEPDDDEDYGFFGRPLDDDRDDLKKQFNLPESGGGTTMSADEPGQDPQGSAQDPQGSGQTPQDGEVDPNNRFAGQDPDTFQSFYDKVKNGETSLMPDEISDFNAMVSARGMKPLPLFTDSYSGMATAFSRDNLPDRGALQEELEKVQSGQPIPAGNAQALVAAGMISRQELYRTSTGQVASLQALIDNPGTSPQVRERARQELARRMDAQPQPGPQENPAQAQPGNSPPVPPAQQSRDFPTEITSELPPAPEPYIDPITGREVKPKPRVQNPELIDLYRGGSRSAGPIQGSINEMDPLDYNDPRPYVATSADPAHALSYAQARLDNRETTEAFVHLIRMPAGSEVLDWRAIKDYEGPEFRIVGDVPPGAIVETWRVTKVNGVYIIEPYHP